MTPPRDDGRDAEAPEDLGEPLSELAELDEAPSPDFGRRVRSSILRRGFAGDLIELALLTPLRVLLEFLALAFGRTRGAPPNADKE